MKYLNDSNRFHLAIAVKSIEESKEFYCDLMGCVAGDYEEGRWQDINFWGNELTLHQSKPRESDSLERHRHSVDMGDVIVPHLGIHLPLDEYQRVKSSVASTVGFVDEPYIRFEDSDYQQETFFVEDPNYNVLEIKSMVKPRD